MKRNDIIEGNRDAYQRDYDSSVSGFDGRDGRDDKNGDAPGMGVNAEDSGQYSIWTQGPKDEKPKKILSKQCSMDDAERHANAIKKKHPYLKVWWQAHHLGKGGIFPVSESTEDVSEDNLPGQILGTTGDKVTIDNKDGTQTVAPKTSLTRDPTGKGFVLSKTPQPGQSPDAAAAADGPKPGEPVFKPATGPMESVQDIARLSGI